MANKKSGAYRKNSMHINMAFVYSLFQLFREINYDFSPIFYDFFRGTNTSKSRVPNVD
jgi:hypothetical protein